MEHAGTWTRTTILVGADHPHVEASALDRKTNGRVRFLLKLPGQKEGKAYWAATFKPKEVSVVG
jgi:hypothetical protein